METKNSVVMTGISSGTIQTHWVPGENPKEKISKDPIVQEVRRLEGFFRSNVKEAWEKAQLDSSYGPQSGAVFGTFYATNSIQEYIISSLMNGSSWLNAEAFLYYSPHSCPGSVVQMLGLHGDAITLVGPQAQEEALVHAWRLVHAGRHRIVLCSVFEWATPFASWLGKPCHLDLNSQNGITLTRILESRVSAEARGAPILAEVCRDSTGKKVLISETSI
jgi:3-oxoacyl-(acyl-carrier-protein) synthase